MLRSDLIFNVPVPILLNCLILNVATLMLPNAIPCYLKKQQSCTPPLPLFKEQVISIWNKQINLTFNTFEKKIN